MTSTATFPLSSPSKLSTRWSHLKHRDDIGRAYLDLLDREPTGLEIYAWNTLAEETARHAEGVRHMFDVIVTDDPEPYPSARVMVSDMRDTGRMLVSRANSEHPVWTPEQNVDFRTVHDGLGHYLSGGAFSWQGELDACSVHFRMIRDQYARRALFTECIGQIAAYYLTGEHVEQAVGFLPNRFTAGTLHA